MPTSAIPRPAAGEYDPYYDTYIAKVPEGDLLATLAELRESSGQLLAEVGEVRAGYRYAPGKWTIREVVGHLSDAERIFAYRLLRIARGDPTPLPGFDEQRYVPAGAFERRPLAQVAAEFRAVRDATLALLRGLDDAALARRGVANDSPVTARALAYIIAGHEIHHVRVIREKYLSVAAGAEG
jgi:uncharacterized damage-inducible protein DinB